MPYLNLKLNFLRGSAAHREIARELTDLAERLLRKQRALTSVAVEHVDPHSWLVGGEPSRLPVFWLDVKVTEGTNTPAEKSAFIAQAFAALKRFADGQLHPASYVAVHELRADAWGYCGRTQASRALAGDQVGNGAHQHERSGDLAHS